LLKAGFPFSLPVNFTVITITAGRNSKQTSAVSGSSERTGSLNPEIPTVLAFTASAPA
jgi:hypothetical protein